jgi:hypothetical protein
MPKAMAWAGPGQSQAISGSFGSGQDFSRPSQSQGFWAKPGWNITIHGIKDLGCHCDKMVFEVGLHVKGVGKLHWLFYTCNLQ